MAGLKNLRRQTVRKLNAPHLAAADAPAAALADGAVAVTVKRQASAPRKARTAEKPATAPQKARTAEKPAKRKQKS